MNHRTSRGYSPMRAKRRQSDAKWRASVATCYDALKYVVPNVKNLSKRKISKALILQECEKHICDLESTISSILHEECEKRGKSILWKEGVCWSQCSLSKLRTDFAEQQRSVFQMSAPGRRCYKLLQDIKEEVFNMSADTRRMAFTTLFLDTTSCSQGLTDTSRTENVKIPTSWDSVQNSCETASTGYELNGLCDMAIHCEMPLFDTCQGNGEGKFATRFPLAYFQSKTNMTKMRQQPEPRKRLGSLEEGAVDAALLTGKSDTKNRDGITTLSTSMACTPVHIYISDRVVKEEHFQKVPTVKSEVAPDETTVSAFTSPITSPSTFSVVVQDDVKRETIESTTADVRSDAALLAQNNSCTSEVKEEKLEENRLTVSYRNDNSCLLKALKSEKEQEVPCLMTPIKKQNLKWPKLTKCASDCEKNGNKGKLADTNGMDQKSTLMAKVNDTDAGNDLTSFSTGVNSRGKIQNLFNSPILMKLSDIETDSNECSNTPNICGDPMLSSISIKEAENSTPLFCRLENDTIIKRPPKLGSARKKLNFDNHPHFLSPDRNRRVHSTHARRGFTPVKLPDEFPHGDDSDNPGDSFVSPWKVFSSHFDSQTAAQGYHDTSSVIDLEDSLLCLENIDSIDLDDDVAGQVTPAQSAVCETAEKSEVAVKGKSRLQRSSDSSSSSQPKCRRKLERIYDQMCLAKSEMDVAAGDSQVVPQIGSNSDGRDISSNEHAESSAHLFSPLKDLDFKDNEEFDGFFFYYQQVSQRLVDKFGAHEVPSPTIAAKVAHMWSNLPEQDKATVATLASLEGHHSQGDDSSFGRLSQDLEEIDVKPLDPQDFLPSFL